MLVVAFLMAGLIRAATAGIPGLETYNVVWDTPSRDASGAMPLGNGDLAASVYALEDGDLYLLLAKSDALTFCGDIFKTGRVKVSLSPNPFEKGKPFRQTLDLLTGSIRIEAGGVQVRVWADANRNVLHVQVTSPEPVQVRADPDVWERSLLACPANKIARESFPAVPPQDTFLAGTGNADEALQNPAIWYFWVGDASVYPLDLRDYRVEEMAQSFPDPFRFGTFGNLLDVTVDGKRAPSRAVSGTSVDVRVYALRMQTPEPAREWGDAIRKMAERPVEVAADWEAHCAWWRDFWARGWICASDTRVDASARNMLKGEYAGGRADDADGAALVSRAYMVNRFFMASQSRGPYQAKFNGGLFTQQLRVDKERPFAVRQVDGSWLTHEDDRMWGRRFTFQNQRLLYWPLLMSGDFDLMKPFFDQYLRLLPMRKAITKAHFGHDGAYYRENIELDGAERDCNNGILPPKTRPGETYGGWYHDYYFTAGLETVAMMLDYVRYAPDGAAFCEEALVPFAREILTFFDQHYPRDANGKIRLEPAQVLETYWVAVNPAPDIAGLRYCIEGLLALDAGTPDDRAHWRRLHVDLPRVPLREIEGRAAIAPADTWEKCHNSEIGELYPAFPFRLFGLAEGSKDIVDWTIRHLANKGAMQSHCWAQNEIFWALSANVKESAEGLVKRFRTAAPICRFPLFGREGPDSCPDFDHFGAGAVAFQRMLAQESHMGKIYLFPAWPAQWDVDFKLHLSKGTVVTGQVKDGKIVMWDITPPARKADVEVQALVVSD